MLSMHYGELKPGLQRLPGVWLPLIIIQFLSEVLLKTSIVYDSCKLP